MTQTTKRPSERAIARALGVAENALREARLSGRVPKDEFDVERLRQAWIASTLPMGPAPLAARGDSSEHAADSTEPTLAEARRRKEIAIAEIRELEVGRRRGELVSAAEVERQWTETLGHVRNKMLAIPAAVKQAIPHLEVADVVKVENLIRRALEDLADGEAAPSAPPAEVEA